MQLIQIGQPVAATVQQMVEQMAARQFAEIEQLRQTAMAKRTVAKSRRHYQNRCSLIVVAPQPDSV